jgi:hypothetical protein
MNTSTTNVDSCQESIQTRIAQLTNQTDQLTNTVLNRYMHRTHVYTSMGVHTDLKGGIPVESAKADQATIGTQTTFFFAPGTARVDASFFSAGTWFFIQKQVWCLLENLVSVKIQDMHSFTSALSGQVNGAKCIGLARQMCLKYTSHLYDNTDTHIRQVMITEGDIIILPQRLQRSLGGERPLNVTYLGTCE